MAVPADKVILIMGGFVAATGQRRRPLPSLGKGLSKRGDFCAFCGSKIFSVEIRFKRSL